MSFAIRVVVVSFKIQIEITEEPVSIENQPQLPLKARIVSAKNAIKSSSPSRGLGDWDLIYFIWAILQSSCCPWACG